MEEVVKLYPIDFKNAMIVMLKFLSQYLSRNIEDKKYLIVAASVYYLSHD